VERERIHSKRPKNKPFFAVKNFSSERYFLDTLFLLLKKSIWFEGIRDKTIRTMARSVFLFFLKKQNMR
jgi:hypothetical protein